MADHRHFLVHGDAERLEAGEIGIRIGLDVDLVLAVEEIGNAVIGAGQLADHIGCACPARAIGVAPIGHLARLQPEQHDVIADPVGAGEGRAVEGEHLQELLGIAFFVARNRGQRTVVEPAFLPGACAIVEAQRGGAFRRAVEIAAMNESNSRLSAAPKFAAKACGPATDARAALAAPDSRT